MTRSKVIEFANKLEARVIKQADAVDYLHGGLDLIGLIPGLGEPFDVANAALYAAQGHMLMAALSTISVIPEFGDIIGKGGKLAIWVGNNSGKAAKLSPQVARAMRGVFRLAVAALTNNRSKIEAAIDKLAEDSQFAGIKNYVQELKSAVGQIQEIIVHAEEKLGTA